MQVYESVEIHDILNPKLWDNNTEKLLPNIRIQFMSIIDMFRKYIGLPIDIIDVQFVGSNASYNYTDKSDIDLHIMLNFESISQDEMLVQALFDAKKSAFNNAFNINIRGLEVELYVQDINSSTISNGIYSVFENKWIKKPVPIENIVSYDTTRSLNKWKDYIYYLLKNKDRDELQNAINMLYLIRHNSIVSEGEYGKGNQLFKDIRNTGLLQQLKDALDDAISKQLSLENLSEGQIINRMG